MQIKRTAAHDPRLCCSWTSTCKANGAYCIRNGRMPRGESCKMWSSRISVLLLLVATVEAAFAGNDAQTRSFDFRDTHRNGKVAIIGHFGIPIGQIVTIEGSLARPSRVSNASTLRIAKINGELLSKTDQNREWFRLRASRRTARGRR